jgi:hypothetical protein
MPRFFAVPLILLGLAVCAPAQSSKGKPASGPVPPPLNRPSPANPGPLPRETPPLVRPAAEAAAGAGKEKQKNKPKNKVKTKAKAKAEADNPDKPSK